MAAVVSSRGGNGRSPEWARKYPPLAALLAAVLIALFVLPSSLNLPQSNPSTTVELAPVPPNDQSTPPQQSNLSSLSLGTSGTTNGNGPNGSGGGDGLPPPPPPPPPPPLSGLHSKTPSTKNCVGDPPRQTEDPLSPPCVADFTGDNGGSTYQGVTADEVRILVYVDGGIIVTPSPRGQDAMPTNVIIDLDKPPQPNEVPETSEPRGWEHYFNARYQTYGRHVHFFLQYSSTNAGAGGPTPTTRAADAAEGFATVTPFATVSFAQFNSPADPYLLYMAQKGVLNFGSVTGRSETFFQQFPKYIWGYPPTVEQAVHQYVSFVCSKLVPNPVSYSGSGTPHGAPRKFGLIETSDPNFPKATAQAEEVKKGVRACGAHLADADVVQYPTNNYTVDTQQTPQFAVNNMLKLKQDGVTSLLWPIGIEIKQSAAATQLQYYPEWLIGDDTFQSGPTNGQLQDPAQWADAWIVPSVVDQPTLQNQLCYQQYKQADPSATDSDIQNVGCTEYDDLRQLFTGIQVAGPRLGAFSVDRGYHAIPDVASTNSQTPACFYLPGDYTCVKDAIYEWWDPNATGVGNANKGCWKPVLAGKRFLVDHYPPGDPTAQRNPAVDSCNNFDIGGNIRPVPSTP